MPEPFDFEAFINRVVTTEVTVEVSSVDNSYEIDKLREQLESLPDGDQTDKRLGAKSPQTVIQKRIDELTAEEEAAPGLAFRLRPATPDQMRDYVNADDDTDTRYKQLADQCVEPKLTEDQWRKMGEALGAPRFGRVLSAAFELSMREGKSPGFSQSVSAGRRN